MKIKAWAILTNGLADGYELTKSPARVQAARENGQTVVELSPKLQDDSHIPPVLITLSPESEAFIKENAFLLKRNNGIEVIND